MPPGRARRSSRGRTAALLLLMLVGSLISMGVNLAASAGTYPSLAVSRGPEPADSGPPAAVDSAPPPADSGPPPAEAAAAVPEPDGSIVSTSPVADWGGLAGVERLVYRTRGPNGMPTTGTALVRLPSTPAPTGGYRIVAWTHGTSGMGQECGLLGPSSVVGADAPTVARLNDAGYAVVMPDYLGLSPDSPGPHPYLHGETEASATIDAVRAARFLLPDLSTQWTVAGYSQGGHAALAAGNSAPRYAPELDLRGIVALAPTSNVEDIYAQAAPEMPTLPFFPRRNFAAVLNSLRTTHPYLDVTSYLSPVGRELVDRVAGACYGSWLGLLGDRSPGDLLAKPLSDPAFVAALRSHLAVPTAGYDDPILIVHGTRDRTVPLTLTETLTDQFARAGTSYELQVLDAEHADLGARGGIDLAVAFIARVMPVG